jgi:hypothetical protein
MKALMKRRKALVVTLTQCGDVVRGSINSVCGKCNRANCICEKKSGTKAYRLTYKDSRQKTRIVYVAKGRLPEVRRLLANYSRLWKTVEQLIATNVEMFKKGAAC